MYEKQTRILSIPQEPRLQFIYDLKLYINIFRENGDLIILGMNLNDPIQSHDHKTFFDEFFLHDAIILINVGKCLRRQN